MCVPHKSPQEGGIAIPDCYVTPTFSGSPTSGTKSEVATSPMPSRGPKRGRKCFVTRAFSGVTNKGDKIRSGCLNPAFSGAQKRAEVLRNPCILGGLTLPHGGKKSTSKNSGCGANEQKMCAKR